MEPLTIDLAEKIMKRQHAALAELRDLWIRHSRLHQEICDVLGRTGSISEGEYRSLFEKAMEGWRIPEPEPGEGGKKTGET